MGFQINETQIASEIAKVLNSIKTPSVEAFNFIFEFEVSNGNLIKGERRFVKTLKNAED